MQYVRYIGLAHIRRITRDDWRSVGLDHETVEWNRFNGFSVPVDQFSEKELNIAIRSDKRDFIIVGQDSEPQALPENTTPEMLTMPQIDLNSAVGNEPAPVRNKRRS